MISMIEFRNWQARIDWTWRHKSGDWWVEIEEINGRDVAELELTDAELEDLRAECASRYPLAEFQNDGAQDAAEAEARL